MFRTVANNNNNSITGVVGTFGGYINGYICSTTTCGVPANTSIDV